MATECTSLIIEVIYHICFAQIGRRLLILVNSVTPLMFSWRESPFSNTGTNALTV